MKAKDKQTSQVRVSTSNLNKVKKVIKKTGQNIGSFYEIAAEEKMKSITVKEIIQ